MPKNSNTDYYEADKAPAEIIDDLIQCLYDLEAHWDSVTSRHIDVGHVALTVRGAESFLQRQEDKTQKIRDNIAGLRKL